MVELVEFAKGFSQNSSMKFSKFKELMISNYFPILFRKIFDGTQGECKMTGTYKSLEQENIRVDYTLDLRANEVF